ncbi:MAG TPA: LysR family transcriptional regulator [Novosphingobium sp.]|nr:LysR family transcriptional regulator [Novosphingobium sp.]
MDRWEGIEEAVAVADAGSFVGAAALLKVSTSHVSRAIARLEDKLGSSLFHRTTRKVSLTDTGRSFTEQCRRLIQERDEVMAFVSGDGEPQGELRLTCSIAMGERFISPLVRRFATRHPRLSIILDLDNRVVDIVSEGYDVGIRTGDVADRRLVGKKIAVRELATVASPQYLEKRGNPLSVDDLAGHDCIAGTTANWIFLEKGKPRIFVPQGRWRCNSGDVVVAAALEGWGICQLPEFYVRSYVAEGKLMPVLQNSRSEPEVVWMVYPQRRHLLPKVRLLAEELERSLQSSLDRVESLHSDAVRLKHLMLASPIPPAS